MKIGVDAQVLMEKSAGTTYYAQGILESLLKIDRENFYDLLLWRLFPKPPVFMFGREPHFSYRYQRFFPYKVFYKLFKWGMGLPLELFFGGSPDIYFFPNFVIYPHSQGKSVVVVHDLTFEKVPQYVAARNVDFLRKFVPGSCRQADHIVTISQAAKKDIVQSYNIPADKITVVYPAVNTQTFYPRASAEKEAVKKKYGIKKPFVLYLGTLEPRKNVPAVIKAYAGLKNRKDFNLVLAGKRGWMDEEIFEQVKSLKIEDDVIFTGYVPDEDRPRLMSAAEIFVFPSFFEGFGMPVVEAQACGVPVVTSNTTSLPEAAGEGAILVDPRRIEDIKTAIEKILSSPKLQNDLKEKGFRNARRFRWDDSGKKLIKIFNNLS